MLFCGRYRFSKSVPQYASATCEVWFALDVHSLEHAVDTGGSPTEKSVCLKIMKNQDEYDREIQSRKGIDTQYVVEIDTEESERVTKEFAVNVHKLPRQSNFFPTERDHKTNAGKEEKPLEAFCLVMECGECNFGEMLKNRKLAGDRIRLMEPLQDIAKFLSHLHDKDLVHCDVKAQNVVRMASGDIKGIDLDGAATEDDGLFGTKTSSAFLPPECVGLDNDSNAYYIKSADNKNEVLSLPLSLALALSRECVFARTFSHTFFHAHSHITFMHLCKRTVSTLFHARPVLPYFLWLAGKDYQSATHYRHLAVWHAALPRHGRQGPLSSR